MHPWLTPKPVLDRLRSNVLLSSSWPRLSLLKLGTQASLYGWLPGNNRLGRACLFRLARGLVVLKVYLHLLLRLYSWPRCSRLRSWLWMLECARGSLRAFAIEEEVTHDWL